MMGISITKLLIVAAIIVLLFGTKKLRSLGSDLGAAIKGFKESLDGDEKKTEQNKTNDADFSPKITAAPKEDADTIEKSDAQNQNNKQ